MTPTPPETPRLPEDEPPGLPGLRRWGQVYALVLIVFALVVAGLAAFTARHR